MKLATVGILMLLSCTFAHGEAEVEREVPVSLFRSLQAAHVSCPKEIMDDESQLFCGSTRRNATSFKEAVEAVDADTLAMRPTGNWESYEGKDVQRSYLYRDGFMTVALYEGMAPNDHGLVIVRVLTPHD